MYLVREVLHCRPGRVRDVVKKFQAMGAVMKRMKHEPFRIYTDVSAERFWTLVLESEHESLNAFSEMEREIMADPEAKKAMEDYHELVLEGRREIYRVEG